MIFGVDDRTAKIIGAQFQNTTAAKNSEGNKVYDFFTGANYNLMEVALGVLGNAVDDPTHTMGIEGFVVSAAYTLKQSEEMRLSAKFDTNMYRELKGLESLDYAKRNPGIPFREYEKRVQQKQAYLDFKTELIKKTGKWKD